MSADAQLLFAELGAAQFMLLALIESHPDKPRLKATFEAMVTGFQVHAAASGDASPTPPLMRAALQRYLAQLSNRVS